MLICEALIDLLTVGKARWLFGQSAQLIDPALPPGSPAGFDLREHPQFSSKGNRPEPLGQADSLSLALSVECVALAHEFFSTYLFSLCGVGLEFVSRPKEPVYHLWQ